jgi:hypothetical protein
LCHGEIANPATRSQSRVKPSPWITPRSGSFASAEIRYYSNCVAQSYPGSAMTRRLLSYLKPTNGCEVCGLTCDHDQRAS